MSSCRQAVRGFKPWARQVPKIDASVILVAVPWFERRATTDLPADHYRAQAAFGGVIVRRRRRFSHEDEELFDVAFNASA